MRAGDGTAFFKEPLAAALGEFFPVNGFLYTAARFEDVRACDDAIRRRLAGTPGGRPSPESVEAWAVHQHESAHFHHFVSTCSGLFLHRLHHWKYGAVARHLFRQGWEQPPDVVYQPLWTWVELLRHLKKPVPPEYGKAYDVWYSVEHALSALLGTRPEATVKDALHHLNVFRSELTRDFAFCPTKMKGACSPIRSKLDDSEPAVPTPMLNVVNLAEAYAVAREFTALSQSGLLSDHELTAYMDLHYSSAPPRYRDAINYFFLYLPWANIGFIMLLLDLAFMGTLDPWYSGPAEQWYEDIHPSWRADAIIRYCKQTPPAFDLRAFSPEHVEPYFNALCMALNWPLVSQLCRRCQSFLPLTLSDVMADPTTEHRPLNFVSRYFVYCHTRSMADRLHNHGVYLLGDPRTQMDTIDAPPFCAQPLVCYSPDEIHLYPRSEDVPGLYEFLWLDGQEINWQKFMQISYGEMNTRILVHDLLFSTSFDETKRCIELAMSMAWPKEAHTDRAGEFKRWQFEHSVTELTNLNPSSFRSLLDAPYAKVG